MSPKQVIAAAMHLSDEGRAEVAGELIRSLDPPPDVDVEQAWDEEIKRRVERLNAGTAQTVPWEEARQRIRAAALAPLPRLKPGRRPVTALAAFSSGVFRSV